MALLSTIQAYAHAHTHAHTHSRCACRPGGTAGRPPVPPGVNGTAAAGPRPGMAEGVDSMLLPAGARAAYEEAVD